MTNAPPKAPASPLAQESLPLRYEDVDQAGHLTGPALAYLMGKVCWGAFLSEEPLAAAARRTGVLPILTRLTVDVGDAPVSTRDPVTVVGGYELAHVAGVDGAVERIVLVMSATITGTVGRTHGAPPDNAGQPISLGRVVAEHVFTRPFAPPGARKVVALEFPGVPAVPPARYAWQAGEEIATLLSDASAFHPAPLEDPCTTVFGVSHTDSNQHVNSLTYPRMCEEAALRALRRCGVTASLRLVRFDIRFRKPCFAGEEVGIAHRAYRSGDGFGSVGTVQATSEARPRAHFKVELSDR